MALCAVCLSVFLPSLLRCSTISGTSAPSCDSTRGVRAWGCLVLWRVNRIGEGAETATWKAMMIRNGIHHVYIYIYIYRTVCVSPSPSPCSTPVLFYMCAGRASRDGGLPGRGSQHGMSAHLLASLPIRWRLVPCAMTREPCGLGAKPIRRSHDEGFSTRSCGTLRGDSVRASTAAGHRTRLPAASLSLFCSFSVADLPRYCSLSPGTTRALHLPLFSFP